MKKYRECITLAAKTPEAWVIATIFSLLVGAFIGLGILLPLLDRAPTMLLPSRVLSTTVKQGGYLEFAQKAPLKKGRSCPGSITREFHRLVERDGKTVWQKWRAPLSGAAIDIDNETEWTVAVELLPGMEPGHWRMQGESTYACWLIFGGTFKYRIPPLEFDIIPADAK